MHDLHEETKRLIHEVLTPAQRTEAQRLRREHMQRHLQRRVERMATRLSLTDSQKTAVTRIFENARYAPSRTLHRESGPVDREAMQALRRQTRTELSGVLTAEQMEAASRQMRAEHRASITVVGVGAGGVLVVNGGGIEPIRNAAP